MAPKRVSSAQKAAQFEQQFFGNVNFQTELGDLLLSLYSWGKIPATIVQRVAQAAMNDCNRCFGECRIQEWQVLAKLGDYGARVNNISRDLSVKFPENMFPLTQVTIPLKVAKSKGMIQTAMCQVPFLLPEDSWKIISQNDASNIPDAANIQSWWESCGRHPALLHHPVKKVQNFATRAVPCVLHGDGAAVTQNIGSSSKSCLFLSYKMLCADQADHMLICGLWNQLCSDSKNFRTISTIWTLVAKSFEQLLNGAIHHSEKFPVLVFTTGDLEYFNVYHNLPRWNSLNPCHYCEITLKDLKRCRVVAPLPPDGWPTPGKTLWKNFCPLWKTLSPYSVAVDWMHSKHLGLDQRMLGSVLWLLTFHIFKSRGSIEERLALLLHKFKEYWRQNAVHGGLNSLTLGVLAIVAWFAFLFSGLSNVFFKKIHSLFWISNGDFMQVWLWIHQNLLASSSILDWKQRPSKQKWHWQRLNLCGNVNLPPMMIKSIIGSSFVWTPPVEWKIFWKNTSILMLCQSPQARNWSSAWPTIKPSSLPWRMHTGSKKGWNCFKAELSKAIGFCMGSLKATTAILCIFLVTLVNPSCILASN